ncbi:M2 family metallopeptidase [bacterium]|jgi:peptidyl-dipeptidase A|nr:M2 family metallopeptidase [bacterium]
MSLRKYGVLAGLIILGSSGAQASVIDEARHFMNDAEAKIETLVVDSGRADWVKSTYITDDTEIIAAKANEAWITKTMEFAKKSMKYKNAKLPADLERKMQLLRVSFPFAAPSNPKESAELTRLLTSMEGTYGKGKWCKEPGKPCLDITEISKIISTSQDPKELLAAWDGWHQISRPMKKDYTRFVELANKGARELGFKDTGDMWKSQFDMPADAFAKDVDRIWNQVKPLYESLHAYTRKKLREKYGASVVPESGPIPAHLLGNLWAQEWNAVAPIVIPEDMKPGDDLDEVMAKNKVTPVQMMKYGEGFFTSLGLPSLPESFWTRSQFVKPLDREVVCHASAWDIDTKDDLRIKMCIKGTGEDFVTTHHELGHTFYQRAYKDQPLMFREGANDGFHEAIGDTVALSITPAYLQKVGLISKVTNDPKKDTGQLLSMALERLVFFPFGIMMDKWRWKVFNGEIKPSQYNQAWWDLKREYQGIAPAGRTRTEADFDPGAKYHIPANVSYVRYFVARVLQFQFHQSLAKAAGCTEPLHRCSIYGNEKAGRMFREMLAEGRSKPWPETLKKLTGKTELDAGAVMEYFAPLKKWLDEQNKGTTVGWDAQKGPSEHATGR